MASDRTKRVWKAMLALRPWYHRMPENVALGISILPPCLQSTLVLTYIANNRQHILH